MEYKSRKESLVKLGIKLQNYLENKNEESAEFMDKWDVAIANSYKNNVWFIEKFQKNALLYWANHLTDKNLDNWLSKYTFSSQPETVGLVLAGNIPMVGLHDVLCALLSGKNTQIKLSSKDAFLIPLFLQEWKNLCPDLEFHFVERLSDFDKVIATGTNNTARYFSYYFKNVPHIIRKNRTSVAVLNGNESEKELDGLAKDIALYFGLGCRNVTQLWIPKNYDLNRIFKALYTYHVFADHTKYFHSYEYYKAIYMLNQDDFWDNNFMLLKRSSDLFSPIATVNFIEYSALDDVQVFLEERKNEIQCVVGNAVQEFESIAFGEAQNPSLDSYADGVDVMEFLN